MARQSHTFAEGKFKKMLHEAGCRVTSQRLLLLNLLHDCQGHAGADDLYHLARIQDPRLSLSTVYRTLNKLKEVSLVRELHLDDEHQAGKAGEADRDDRRPVTVLPEQPGTKYRGEHRCRQRQGHRKNQ